jgi:hypothetical protein
LRYNPVRPNSRVVAMPEIHVEEHSDVNAAADYMVSLVK